MATTITSATSGTTGSITSLGTGSGLDLSGLLTKLMAAEQAPINLLNTQEASAQAKISAYGSLSSALSSLKQAADDLGSNTLFAKFTATPTDDTVLSATANAAAVKSTHTITVANLATAQTLTSQTFSSSSDAITTAGGKLQFELGTFSGGIFTADSAKTPVTVDIAAGSSLSSIRDQINSADAGVTARLVSVDSAGTQFKLSITSNTIGNAGSLRISALDSSGAALTKNNTDLARLSFDPAATAGAGNEYTIASPAQDAHITVDGVDLYRNSNVIGDAITGISLTLTKAGTTNLTIAADTTAIQTALQTFVTKYNDTVKLGKQLSAYDSTNSAASILTGDSATRNLLYQLGNMIGLTGPGDTSGSTKRLADLGISVQRDGTLTLNTSTLSTALQNSTANVQSLLASRDTSLSSKGIAVQMSSLLNTMLASDGLINNSISNVQATIKRIDTRRTEMQQRLAIVEANYRKQFTALDTLVASMQQTSSYLTQQLSSIQKTTTG